MNAVERAQRDILFVLVMEANRSASDIPDLKDLKAKYNLKISDIVLDSSIDPWEARDLLIVSRTYDGTAARIKSSKYASALIELLNLLDATSFDVDWAKEEILTDAKSDDSWPVLEGWKIFEYSSSNGGVPAPETRHQNIVSSSWTGLPADFELTEIKRQSLVRDLEAAEVKLANLDLSQEVQAQARAYFIAARVLAEAPDPPADVIWSIIGRANSLAGIASLLVSIVALFH